MRITCVMAAALSVFAAFGHLCGQQLAPSGSRPSSSGPIVHDVEAPAGTSLSLADGEEMTIAPEGGVICAANGFAVPVPLTSYEASRWGSFSSWIFRRYAGSVEMQEKVYYPPGYTGWYYFRPWKPDWINPLPPSPIREEHASYPTMPPHGATLNGLQQPPPAVWGAARPLRKSPTHQFR